MELEKILPKDGPPIEEVHKYVQKYKTELIVIKYGGNVNIDREIFNNFISVGKIPSYFNGECPVHRQLQSE